MASIDEKNRGMVWGQFTGDAAALGAHWIYDAAELARAYPEGIQGFEAPLPSHYHAAKAPGDQTHYGDAALCLLESLEARQGLDIADFAARFQAFFLAPDCPAYKDHATRDTLKNLAADPGNFANGADDDQPATLSRLAALPARLLRDPAGIETLTRFCQNNDRAVAYARAHAQILSALLEGASLSDAFAAVTEPEPAMKIAEARAARALGVVEATLHFGQGCPLEKTFPSAVHAALAFPEDFQGAILETIRAGGDSAARAAMVGAWLGASLGESGVPAAWRERLTHKARIAQSLQG